MKFFGKEAPDSLEFFRPRKIWRLEPVDQLGLAALLLTVNCWVLALVADLQPFPLVPSLVFAPLFEEVIFRGWLLPRFASRFSPRVAISLVSVLFGLWHLKNFPWLDPAALLWQIVWAGLVLGPLLGFVALRCRSIWPGVLLHQLNNIFAFLQIFLLAKFFS